MKYIWRILARPQHRRDSYPWRPMDNEEKRAAWALKYHLGFGRREEVPRG